MICFTDYRFNFICFFIIYANPTLLHGHTVNRVGFAVFYRFTQQNLPAWKPAMTPGCVSWHWLNYMLSTEFNLLFNVYNMVLPSLFQVITIFLMIGVTFVPVGLVCLHASNHVNCFSFLSGGCWTTISWWIILIHTKFSIFCVCRLQKLLTVMILIVYLILTKEIGRRILKIARFQRTALKKWRYSCEI